MIKIFIILILYNGDMYLLDQKFPTFDMCQKVKAVVEGRLVNENENFDGRLLCLQSETGERDDIYYQASAAYR